MIEILVNDSKSGGYENNFKYFADIDQWAKENCKTYISCQIQDVSDVSIQWDEIACYRFTDESEETTLFRLKWL